jgi:hypothetical protein
MTEDSGDLQLSSAEATGSIADLFLAASQELARSDARLYRSLDRHLRRTREILEREEGTDQENIVSQVTGDLNGRPALLQGAPSFERQPRRSLELLCKKHQIRGFSRMRKVEMINQLKRKGVGAPTTPLSAFTKAELLTLIQDLITKRDDAHES